MASYLDRDVSFSQELMYKQLVISILIHIGSRFYLNESRQNESCRMVLS